MSEEVQTAMTICPTHRKKLTSDWAERKGSTCSYPTHRGPRRRMKNVRRVNVIMSAEILEMHPAVVPIGSGWFSMNELLWGPMSLTCSISRKLSGIKNSLNIPAELKVRETEEER